MYEELEKILKVLVNSIEEFNNISENVNGRDAITLPPYENDVNSMYLIRRYIISCDEYINVSKKSDYKSMVSETMKRKFIDVTDNTKEVIKNSIEIISKNSKDDGGWRYDFNREGYSDMSVSSNVLWFLKASKKAGFVVSDELINNGENYIVSCGSPGGEFLYRSFSLHATPNMVGLGLIALHKDGNLDNSLLGVTRDHMVIDYNKSTIEELKNRRYQLYGCFYASIGMYYFGDKYWDPWFL